MDYYPDDKSIDELLEEYENGQPVLMIMINEGTWAAVKEPTEKVRLLWNEVNKYGGSVPVIVTLDEIDPRLRSVLKDVEEEGRLVWVVKGNGERIAALLPVETAEKLQALIDAWNSRD